MTETNARHDANTPKAPFGRMRSKSAAAALMLLSASACLYSMDSLAPRPPVEPRAAPADAGVMPNSPHDVDLHRFALNALLVPLFDDAVPPNWSPLALEHCGGDARVMVDGKPMVSGMPIPAAAFTVRWVMDHCTPFGLDSVALSGPAELLVFHEDTGLSAVVSPAGLRIDNWPGGTTLHGPFASELSF